AAGTGAGWFARCEVRATCWPSRTEMATAQLERRHPIVAAPLWREAGGGDVMQHYLHEIGTISLLTAAQEVDIGRRLEAGQTALRRSLGTIALVVTALAEDAEALRAGTAALEDVVVSPE